ncbi:hypothetical protein OS493_034479 [Desmophyllum pertusum]|uniref:Uncharacterized protein n=1 Tax=Desmophyllum pertusum TaxID=174260 RepID=A0A9W9YV82_9CNID|nr:hypothetical protein OS493_034479 [Desmophyllum pertusum]
MVKAEGVQLVCPAEAVDNCNPVSINIIIGGPRKLLRFDSGKGDLKNDVMFGGPILNLQPNGLLFKKPVTLTTKIKIDEGNLKSVVLKKDSSELALVFMSQDIFHEPYYVEHDASALVQLGKRWIQISAFH